MSKTWVATKLDAYHGSNYSSPNLEAANMKHILSILLLALSITAASAGELPSYYPTEFDSVGIVEQVDKLHTTIKINGATFPYPTSIQIHSLEKKIDTIWSIKPGMKISFRTEEANKLSSYRRKVVEIWILPDDFLLDLG